MRTITFNFIDIFIDKYFIVKNKNLSINTCNLFWVDVAENIQNRFLVSFIPCRSVFLQDYSFDHGSLYLVSVSKFYSCLWIIQISSNGCFLVFVSSLVFKELLTRLSEEKRNGAPHLPKIGDIKKASRYSIPDLAVDVEQVIGLEKVNKKSKANTVGGRNKLKKILDKTRISILPQKPYKWVSV